MSTLVELVAEGPVAEQDIALQKGEGIECQSPVPAEKGEQVMELVDHQVK